MITLRDTLRLSLTKLRTRKVRTITTILLASVLFGALIASSLMVTGVFRSIENFQEDGLTSRFIVGVTSASDDATSASQVRRDPELIAEAKERYEKLVEKKTAEAERLGLNYTQASDQPPYTQSPDGKEEYLTMAPIDRTGIVGDLLREHYAGIPVIDDDKLMAVAKQYGATDLFFIERGNISFRGSLDVSPDGKEIFYDQSSEEESDANYVEPILEVSGMLLAPEEIADPFILPDTAGWAPESGSIPIIMPQDAVERLLGKEMPSDTASVNEKLEYMEQLRTDAASLSFQACYRNKASLALIQQTIHQQKDIKANEDEDNYEKPSLIYELPDPTKCENPTIVSDTRSDDEKKRDENQKIFDKKFNDEAEAASYFIPFKVVGISPSGPDTKRQAGSIGDVIGSLLGTNGIGQVVPDTLYSQLSEESKQKYADIFTYEPMYFMGNEDSKIRFVEFATASNAQRFIDEQGCKVEVDGKCHPEDRDYNLTFAFTNSAALEDVKSKATEWLRYGMLGAILIAAIIMWITIGRAIADGRRETAVFRAIGFKRMDIAYVYVLYTILLSILVAACAAVMGWIGAYIAQRQLSPGLTAQAQYSFGGLDMSKEMSLMGIDQRQLLLIFIACLATGLLSMVVPLLSNVRRSPIRDMRDE